MIASQVSRLARATATNHTCAAQRSLAVSRSTVTAGFSRSECLHQRRLSSSKTSCPPGDGSNGARPATTASQTPQPARAPNARSSSGKQTRGRRSKEAEWTQKRAKESDQDAAFKRLPSVPSTHNMQPADITLSSFFSLHRPLSLSKPLPPPTDQEAFERIFESSSSRSKSADVIYTIQSAIDTLEDSSQDQSAKDLRWEIIQESPSNAESGGQQVRHLDGAPRTRNLEEVVAHLRPYTTPPPPVPLEDLQAAAARKEKAARRAHGAAQQHNQAKPSSRDRSFKSTIYLQETTRADGSKFYRARATPIERITNSERSKNEPEVAETQTPASQDGGQVRRGLQMPFRDRMRQRHYQFMEHRSQQLLEQRRQRTRKMDEMREKDSNGQGERSIRERDARRERGKMYAISVKRQRKLKMKKHKYKKLMKRTRNLRRRLDRA